MRGSWSGWASFGGGAWPQFEPRLIGPLAAAPLCAPAMRPRLRDWDDLHRQTFYCARSRCAETLETFRHPQSGAYPRRVVTFETLMEAARAVEEGLGVMSGVMPLMSGLVRRGRLAMAGPARPTTESLWLLVPSGRPVSQRIVRVGDWLVDSFERLQQAGPGGPAAR